MPPGGHEKLCGREAARDGRRMVLGNMTAGDRLLSWAPQSVSIPAGASIERTFDGYGLTPSELARCDRRTVFCDVFLAPDDRELLCIGPSFANLGRPRAVLEGGSTSLRFGVEEPVSGEPVALTRIRLKDPCGPALDLRFVFADFDVRAGIAPRRPVLPPAPLLLSTLQKDNDPQWVEDWCAWHHRAHGVERIVIYDNGSANGEEIRSRLARAAQDSGYGAVIVDWDFPYGPPLRAFTQTVALNHCRLAFGGSAQWCINLDVDEYLYNASGRPLAGHLDLRRRRSVHYLTGLVVPKTADRRPARCFDSAVRFREVEAQRGPKYVYRPGRVGWIDVHRVRPRLVRGAEAAYGLGVAAWRRLGLRRKLRLPGRLLNALAGLAARALQFLSRRGRSAGGRAAEAPGPLFFYHFRALNTGWKHQSRVVDVDTADVVADPRIARMKDLIEADADRFRR